MGFFDDFDDDDKESAANDTANDEPSGSDRDPCRTSPDMGGLPENFWNDLSQASIQRRKTPVSLVILLLLLTCMCIFAIIVTIKGRGWLINLISGDQHIEFTLPVADTPSLDDQYYDDQGRYTTQGIAKAVSPSVVSIEIYQSGMSFAPVGQGSGIIMTQDGYILTNAHVVDQASAGIKAVLSDGTEYEAKLVGMDTASDIAVIKIPANGLSPAQFGNSDNVSLGEDIVTIGSPAGFYGSVTKGIVSGLDRMIRVEKTSTPMSCIQIDAAINPGNSGGALLNMWGQVIGITSSKLASSDYDGIGFAISINAAKPIIERLMEYGYVENRVRIGITFYEISQTTADMYGIEPGIYVVSVDPECDISNSGLQPDDIITEFDGTPIADPDSVEKFLESKKPGDIVTARVYRQNETGGEEFEISFKLMEDKGSLVPAE